MSARLLAFTWGLLAALPVAAAPVPIKGDDPEPHVIGPATRAINEVLSAFWKDNDLKPAERSDDHTFLRRVMLDIAGRIATPDEVRDFTRDTRADKRLRLIDRLLRSPEYSAYWSEVWSDWLLPQPIPAEPRQRFTVWLAGELGRKGSFKDLTEKLLTASGKPSENPAVLFTLAHLGEQLPKKQWAEDGRFDLAPFTDRIGRFFLGTDLNCVRCHDHPYNPDLKQANFWGINAFLRQVDRIDALGEQAIRDNPELNKEGKVLMQRRNGIVVPITPTFLDGTRLKPDDKRPRRQVLAGLVTSHVHFNHALINRLWTQLLGRGLTESPGNEDFGDYNPFVHPQLMERLSAEIGRMGDDPRQLIRAICASDAYQLRSAGGTPANGDLASFHRMKMKPLDRRRRLNALLTALRADVTLNAEQRIRLGQAWGAVEPVRMLNCEMHLETPRPPSVGVIFETVRFLLESPDIQAALTHKEGTVARAMTRKQPAEILDELYLAVFNRFPTAKEAKDLLKILSEAQPEAISDKAWQDLFWVMLSGSGMAYSP